MTPWVLKQVPVIMISQKAAGPKGGIFDDESNLAYVKHAWNFMGLEIVYEAFKKFE